MSCDFKVKNIRRIPDYACPKSLSGYRECLLNAKKKRKLKKATKPKKTPTKQGGGGIRGERRVRQHSQKLASMRIWKQTVKFNASEASKTLMEIWHSSKVKVRLFIFQKRKVFFLFSAFISKTWQPPYESKGRSLSIAGSSGGLIGLQIPLSSENFTHYFWPF